MKLSRVMAGTLVGALAVGTAFAGKDEPKQSVTYAKSWEAAVEEAKSLNVPIVMHNHGFYCPPCWGMHAAVLHNEKYIAFAADNTVEVIAQQDLQKGIDEGKDRRAETYDAKDEKGNPVKYMVEWPGLTREDMLALHGSKASTYNKTNGIPYTSIIDPFTQDEIKGLPGGQSVKTVMAEVEAAKAQLNKSHGPSLKRSTLNKFNAGAKTLEESIVKNGAAKSLAEFKKFEAAFSKEGSAFAGKLEALKTKVLDAAKSALDTAEGLISSGDLKAAAAILNPLAKELKGTDLAERATELLAKTKPTDAK